MLRTKSMLRTMMQLKTIYRKRSTYVKQSNNYNVNRLVEEGIYIITEPMNYKALQKRSKNSGQQEKTSEVTNKNSIVKPVHKYKRRKRFGHSILVHSPSAFIQDLQSKAIKYGGTVTYVDIKNYRASQYDHVTDTYKKCSLSERSKPIGGKIVQRDCYSAFLLYHIEDETHPNRVECLYDFKHFLHCQNMLIDQHIKNANFGLIIKQAA